MIILRRAQDIERIQILVRRHLIKDIVVCGDDLRGWNKMPDPKEDFQELLLKAIDAREKALYPVNPLFELPLDVAGEEIVRKEQTLLKCILGQFRTMFEVEQ